jgi:hypothetical protein
MPKELSHVLVVVIICAPTIIGPGNGKRQNRNIMQNICTVADSPLVSSPLDFVKSILILDMVYLVQAKYVRMTSNTNMNARKIQKNTNMICDEAG